MSFTCMSFRSEALYKPRFETEVCGNSEMAYLHGFQQYSYSYPSRAFWHQASSFFSTWKSFTLLSEPVSSITPWTWSAGNKQVSFKVPVHIWRWNSARTQSKVMILKASCSFNIFRVTPRYVSQNKYTFLKHIKYNFRYRSEIKLPCKY